MIYRLVVPGPLEHVEEVRVLEWHKQEGGALAPGDLLVEVETDKAVVEIRAGQAGIVRRILFAAGDWQKLGGTLALLSDSNDEPMPETSTEDATVLITDFEIV